MAFSLDILIIHQISIWLCRR